MSIITRVGEYLQKFVPGADADEQVAGCVALYLQRTGGRNALKKIKLLIDDKIYAGELRTAKIAFYLQERKNRQQTQPRIDKKAEKMSIPHSQGRPSKRFAQKSGQWVQNRKQQPGILKQIIAELKTFPENISDVKRVTVVYPTGETLQLPVQLRNVPLTKLLLTTSTIVDALLMIPLPVPFLGAIISGTYASLTKIGEKSAELINYQPLAQAFRRLSNRYSYLAPVGTLLPLGGFQFVMAPKLKRLVFELLKTEFVHPKVSISEPWHPEIKIEFAKPPPLTSFTYTKDPFLFGVIPEKTPMPEPKLPVRLFE